MQTMLELPQPLLSRHLAYLRNAELVQDRRDGTRVFYSLTLDDEVGDALREFLEKVFPLFEIFQTDSTNMRALIERGQCSGIVSTEFPTQPSHQSTGEVNRSHV